MGMTIPEAVGLLTSAAIAAGYTARVERSPVSDTRYVELAQVNSGGWTCRVRVSDHDRPGGQGRYPLEVRAGDPVSAIDELLASLGRG